MTNSAMSKAIQIPRMLCHLHEAESLVHDVCAVIDMQPKQAYFVTLAVSELISNIVRHGVSRHCPDVVDMRLERLVDKLVIVVEDHCDALSETVAARYQATTDDAFSNSLTVEDCAESGWGVDLIASTATSVHYARLGERNRMEMQFDIKT